MWHGGTSSVDIPPAKSKRQLSRSKSLADLGASGSSASSIPPLYSAAVLASEASLFAALPVGSVDEELKLCRLRLGRAAAVRTAENRAMTDELTGLANRRALERAMHSHAAGSCSVLFGRTST